MSRNDRIRHKKHQKRMAKKKREGAPRKGPAARGEIPGLDYALAGHKLSTILPEYAKPLLEYASDAQDAVHMLHAAARYWNWSLLPDHAWRKEFDARLRALSPEDRAVALRDVPMMIARKRTLYPDDHRRMDKVSVEVKGDDLRIHVAQQLG